MACDFRIEDEVGHAAQHAAPRQHLGGIKGQPGDIQVGHGGPTAAIIEGNEGNILALDVRCMARIRVQPVVDPCADAVRRDDPPLPVAFKIGEIHRGVWYADACQQA